MTSQQQVQQQYPEARIDIWVNYAGISYTIRDIGLHFIRWHPTPEQAWAEAARNIKSLNPQLPDAANQ